ncbi:DUF4832 domain-containing protein [bacterium]|nr:MAG: DUF4832 domain-containing protein [bacterium]
MAPSMLTLALLAGNVDRALPAGPGPVTNPLKGYAPYVDAIKDTTIPFTMVYHDASWAELEPERGVWKFDEWAARTMRAAPSRDKRAILRVYVDYPNRKPGGIPQWLLDSGVKTTAYSDYGGGLAPDYADPKFRSGIKRLIAEMGRRWNKDPQVAFIQIGLLGFWGEWHTYPRTELFAPAIVQKEVIDAMRAAFPDKPLMARNAADYVGQQTWLGFHDDMIPEDTLGPEEWKFLPTLRASGRENNWKIAPTGGEMVPGAAKRWLGEGWATTLQAVRDTHFSWIGPYCPLLETGDATFKARAIELSQKSGYQFRLTRVRHAGRVAPSGGLNVQVEGMNEGVAPMYGHWPVRIAVLDASGAEVGGGRSPSDPFSWLPGKFFFGAKFPAPKTPGHYRIALGLIDPWTQRSAVRFANPLPVENGWTILSEFDVRR